LSNLLDTNAISELTKPTPNPNVLAWLAGQPSADLYLSAVTIGEMRKGIELARPTAPDFAAKLNDKLESLITHYGDRILPLDEPAAQQWGRFMAKHPEITIEVSQIAAIAEIAGHTVITRNVKDFAPLGIRILNPFEQHPSLING
jgi:predicted nucleic acid-binding protein